jgi:hypothetical protein
MTRAGILSRLLAAAVLTAAVPAFADHGDGHYPASRGDVVRGFRPIDRLGENAIRFSSAPALGGRGVVVELAEQPDGSASGAVTWLLGHPQDDWKRADPVPLTLPPAEWRKLRGEVDVALLKREPAASRADGSLVLCTDGPGYLTERQSPSGTFWVSGFCGDHPNDDVAKLFNALLVEHFASF